MSGKEQNPHLLTSESKDCDLVSLFSLGCGLAKLSPCVCRGDEPQPHHRASQELSCADPGPICTAHHLPELWGQKTSIQEAEVTPEKHRAPAKPPSGLKHSEESRGKSKVEQGLWQSLPRFTCPVFVPPPLPSTATLPKETAVSMNVLNCRQVIAFRMFSCC